MIQLILFDWSGVISNDTRPTFNTYNLLFEHYGVPTISFEVFRNTFELPYGNFCRRHLKEIPLDEISEKFRQLFKTQPHTPSMIKGVDSTLEKLHSRKIHMSVLSSHPYVAKEAALYFPGKNYFSFIYEDIHDKKKAIHDLIRESNIPAHETLFVGDMTYDVEAGNEAGTLTAGVLTGYHSHSVLSSVQPNFIFQNLSEIESIL